MSDCKLSPQARAFSTVLTAFVGSIVNGLTNGAFIAILTAWISWFAVLRVLGGALIALYQAFSSTHPGSANKSPDSDDVALEAQGAAAQGKAAQYVGKRHWLLEHRPRPQFALARKMYGRLSEDVTVLGWIGWIYTAVYSPIVQILWLADNWTDAKGSLKIVRALAISVSALGLTIDTKKRYASRLRSLKYAGAPASVAFNLVNAGSAFAMGVMCAALLIKGAVDTGVVWEVCAVYSVLAVVWAATSFKNCPVQDGGIKGGTVVLNILVGTVAGIFLAVPAFVVMMVEEQQDLTSGRNSSTVATGPRSLGEYLSCEAAPWKKFVAISP